MNIWFGIFILQALMVEICYGDEKETMTDTLLRSQAELVLSHEFTENVFLWHRSRVVPILSDIQKFSIDLYLDAVGVIKTVAEDTRNRMAEFESSECTANHIRRFELQLLSFINRLNFCLTEATRILNLEYYDLNFFDKDGSRVSNHVQNQSLNILSQNDVLDTSLDFHLLINTRLRDLLLRAGPWASNMDELTDLMNHHTEQAMDGITFCHRLMVSQFDAIAARAIDNIAQCA